MEYGDVEVAVLELGVGVVAITVVGVSNAAGQSNGASGSSTAAVTPTMPSGAADGDLIVVVSAHFNNNPGAQPGFGSFRNREIASGTGAVGGGTGYRKLSIFYRLYDGVWTMPSFTVTSVASGCQWVGAIALRKSGPNFEWNNPTWTDVGQDTTAGTGFSTDMGAFDTTPGGLLVIGTGRNDNVTISSPGLSQSGATFGTVTEHCDGGTTLGYDVSGSLHTAPVTVGATGALTFTGTLSGNSQGGSFACQFTETEIATPASFFEFF